MVNILPIAFLFALQYVGCDEITFSGPGAQSLQLEFQPVRFNGYSVTKQVSKQNLTASCNKGDDNEINDTLEYTAPKLSGGKAFIVLVTVPILTFLAVAGGTALFFRFKSKTCKETAVHKKFPISLTEFHLDCPAYDPELYDEAILEYLYTTDHREVPKSVPNESNETQKSARAKIEEYLKKDYKNIIGIPITTMSRYDDRSVPPESIENENLRLVLKKLTPDIPSVKVNVFGSINKIRSYCYGSITYFERDLQTYNKSQQEMIRLHPFLLKWSQEKYMPATAVDQMERFATGTSAEVHLEFINIINESIERERNDLILKNYQPMFAQSNSIFASEEMYTFYKAFSPTYDTTDNYNINRDKLPRMKPVVRALDIVESELVQILATSSKFDLFTSQDRIEHLLFASVTLRNCLMLHRGAKILKPAEARCNEWRRKQITQGQNEHQALNDMTKKATTKLAQFDQSLYTSTSTDYSVWANFWSATKAVFQLRRRASEYYSVGPIIGVAAAELCKAEAELDSGVPNADDLAFIASAEEYFDGSWKSTMEANFKQLIRHASRWAGQSKITDTSIQFAHKENS